MGDIALSQEDIDNLLGGGGLDDETDSSTDAPDSGLNLGGETDPDSGGSDNVFEGLDALLPSGDEENVNTENSSQNTPSSGGSANANTSASLQTSTQGYDSYGNLSALMLVNIDINVVLGKKKTMIKDILSLGEGSIIELDKSASAPVDILANNRPLARGEVVVVDEQFGVRITEKVNPSDPLYQDNE